MVFDWLLEISSCGPFRTRSVPSAGRGPAPPLLHPQCRLTVFFFPLFVLSFSSRNKKQKANQNQTYIRIFEFI